MVEFSHFYELCDCKDLDANYLEGEEENDTPPFRRLVNLFHLFRRLVKSYHIFRRLVKPFHLCRRLFNHLLRGEGQPIPLFKETSLSISLESQ